MIWRLAEILSAGLLFLFFYYSLFFAINLALYLLQQTSLQPTDIPTSLTSYSNLYHVTPPLFHPHHHLSFVQTAFTYFSLSYSFNSSALVSVSVFIPTTTPNHSSSHLTLPHLSLIHRLPLIQQNPSMFYHFLRL